jgi:hypothetical protein
LTATRRGEARRNAEVSGALRNNVPRQAASPKSGVKPPHSKTPRSR